LPLAISRSDPPPLKWSDLRYVSDIKEDSNAKEAYKPEEIVAKLRQVDVLVSQGQVLKELELENNRLCKAVSDPTLDKLILQEAARGNF
jgi:hypothetical protein